MKKLIIMLIIIAIATFSCKEQGRADSLTLSIDGNENTYQNVAYVKLDSGLMLYITKK